MASVTEINKDFSKQMEANLCKRCGCLAPWSTNGLCNSCNERDQKYNSLVLTEPVPTAIPSFQEIVEKRKENTDRIFNDLLDQMRFLHEAKSQDYGNKDPYFNLRAGEQIGIPAWKSALLRLSDKFHRMLNFSKGQTMAVDEKIEDTLLDLANYALITLILYQESKKS